VRPVTGQEFDRYFDRVMPLVAAIAMMKTFLAEEIGRKATAKIQRSNKRHLAKDEKKAIQMAADAAVAKMNPDLFQLDPQWSPRSPQEVKDKLVELKLDAEFKERLTAEVIRICKEAQARLSEYR
jgi:predicted metal-dependent peptidase